MKLVIHYNSNPNLGLQFYREDGNTFDFHCAGFTESEYDALSKLNGSMALEELSNSVLRIIPKDHQAYRTHHDIYVKNFRGEILIAHAEIKIAL